MADRKFNPAAPSNPRKRELERELIVLDFQEHGVTETLLELLEMAKAGHIDGLVFAARRAGRTSRPDELHLFGTSGRLNYNQAEAIGAAVLLQNKLMNEW